jgi:hypothetical protein
LGDPHFLGVQGVFVSAGVITLTSGIASVYALRGATENVERRMANGE